MWAKTLTFNNISLAGSVKNSLINSAYTASNPPIIPTTRIILNQKWGVPTIVNGVYSIIVPVQNYETIT